eukprot:3527430-Rhodomonas_salina.1
MKGRMPIPCPETISGRNSKVGLSDLGSCTSVEHSCPLLPCNRPSLFSRLGKASATSTHPGTSAAQALLEPPLPPFCPAAMQ